MLRVIYRCFLLAVVGCALSWEAAPADAPKPTVAVYPQTASGGVNSQQLADALTQQLVASGNFVVIDRAHIQAVLQEQNIASQGQVTPTTVAQIGRMLGANYIIVVQIDSFTKSSKARSDAVSLLLAQTYQTDVDLADHMTVLEVRSGQILQSISDSQEATSGAYTAQNRSTGDSFVTEAVPKVLAASAAALASKIDLTKMAGSAITPSQVVGKILSIDGDSIILSLAEKDGVSVGQIVDFYDVRLVHNPDTNATIRALVKRGSLQITEVDKDYSVAKPIQGHPRLSQVVKPE